MGTIYEIFFQLSIKHMFKRLAMHPKHMFHRENDKIMFMSAFVRYPNFSTSQINAVIG